MTITIGGNVTYSGTLITIECSAKDCGVVFALSDNYVAARRRDHATWYCPNGHARHYPAESDQEKAERKVRELRAALRDERTAWSAEHDQRKAAERSVRALRGHLTRARNKIAAGNCPAPGCGQHFSNVREHMKFIHPDFKLLDPETGKPVAL